jgi:hypothetical protein
MNVIYGKILSKNGSVPTGNHFIVTKWGNLGSAVWVKRIEKKANYIENSDMSTLLLLYHVLCNIFFNFLFNFVKLLVNRRNLFIRIIDCIALDWITFKFLSHCQIHLESNCTEHIASLEDKSYSFLKEFLAFCKARKFVGMYTKPHHWICCFFQLLFKIAQSV